MGKVLLQTALFVGLFFATWWGLGSIRWMETFRIRTFTNEKQAQLSEWLLEIQRAEKTEIEDEAILGKIRKIKQVICERNGIDTDLIKVHVFDDAEINAFAMPGGHIVVNTELINYCDNADMLAGVMAHEIAHVRMEHVSRRLTREIGIGTLLALSGGGEHLGTLKEILHTLSSRSFDREHEREADKQAVVFIRTSEGDPRQLAYFVRKLADKHSKMPKVMQWISTHPEAQERVEYILAATRQDKTSPSILAQGDSKEFKEAVSASKWAD